MHVHQRRDGSGVLVQELTSFEGQFTDARVDGLTIVRRSSGYERWVKPVVDRIVALVMLVALSPLIAAVALAVLTSLGRPVFYRQTRVGLNGRHFEMVKFRTMLPDRRERRQSFGGPDRRRRHKTPHDPRHTRVGRFLRRFSLDELPQLWHVLTGELSLVGPRPELAVVVEKHYEPWQHARHTVKPGITGLWQVTERDGGRMMHECIDTDLRYIHTVGPATDLRILAQTIPVVLGLRAPGC